MVAVTQLLAHVENAIGGPISDEMGGSIAVVNAAGRHLFSCREWLCASRATTTLSFVSGASYVLLPSDFAEVVQVNTTDTTVAFTRNVTFQEILDLRTSNVSGSGFGYRYAASWRVLGTAVTGLATDTIQPVLEVWPTPTANSSGVFTMVYKAKWPDQTDDNTVVLIPPFLESLLVEFCRAFALAWTDPERGSLGARLADIEAGPLMASCVRQDSAMYANMGYMRGGLLDHHIPFDPIPMSVAL